MHAWSSEKAGVQRAGGCAARRQEGSEQAFPSLLQHGPSLGGAKRELDVPATLDVLRRSEGEDAAAASGPGGGGAEQGLDVLEPAAGCCCRRSSS
jgi:hypothetical protein